MLHIFHLLLHSIVPDKSVKNVSRFIDKLNVLWRFAGTPSDSFLFDSCMNRSLFAKSSRNRQEFPWKTAWHTSEEGGCNRPRTPGPFGPYATDARALRRPEPRTPMSFSARRAGDMRPKDHASSTQHENGLRWARSRHSTILVLQHIRHRLRRMPGGTHGMRTDPYRGLA